MSEIHKEKEKLDERVAFISKQVLNEVTLKDNPKKVKYYISEGFISISTCNEHNYTLLQQYFESSRDYNNK